MADYKIKCDLIWMYQDKTVRSREYTVDADDEYNAAASLQFLIGDSIKIEIISIEKIIS